MPVRTSALLLCLVAAASIAATSQDKTLRIPIPKHSKATPVQKLNRDGVKALEKHDYAKAKKLFYDAYLLDPNDPFTLNNLGYISELSGEIDRAQRFYALSATQKSDAVVDEASEDEAEGKPLSAVTGTAADQAMAVNQANIQAMSFLQKDRAPEADRVLQQALALDLKNPFTLNNLGYAKEKEGEYEAALKYYSEAASLSSEEPVIVAMDPGWRGKPISEIASDNANNLRKLMSREESLPARVARLNLQGVSALNRNERSVARKDFQDAYKLDPHDAFTLNNMGYVAELDGDRETADFFYAKAQEAGSADQKVTVATRQNVEGMKLDEVASGNDQLVQQRMEVALSERRSRGGPVLLLRRDNTPVIDPERPPAPPPAAAPAPAPQSVIPPGGLMMPLPENEQPANTDNSATSLPSQPAATGSTTTTGSVNQPTNTNPISASATPNQPAGGTSGAPANGSQGSGGLLMPLPENQQPTNADHGPTPPTNASPGNETASPPSSPNSNSGENNGGLLMPLPDNQQPTNADHGPAAAPNTPANQNSITPH